jgi:hypothetical protein
MTTQITPSKVVRNRHYPSTNASTPTNFNFLQAASAIEDLKMASPVKKLDFGCADKENAPFNADAPAFEDVKIQKPIVEKAAQDTYTPRADGAIVVNGITYYPEGAKKEELAVTVAPGLRPEEADEPLLQENPQRFVLFPIKYHEVSRAMNAFSREVFLNMPNFPYRSGKCTRRPRLLSGRRKRLISRRIFTTGTIDSMTMSDTLFPTFLHSSQPPMEL